MFNLSYSLPKGFRLDSENSPSTEARDIFNSRPRRQFSSLGSFIPKYRDLENSETSLKLIKRRKLSDTTPLLPETVVIQRIRKGNKLSRIFRHILEHVNIKRILGINLASAFIISSIIPLQTQAYIGSPDNLVTESPIIVSTEYGVRFPLDKVSITQGYKFYHKGVDFDGVTGDRVMPIMTGVVVSAGYSRVGYGNTILVDHDNGFTSLYAHLSLISVSQGQKVAPVTKLGEVGSSGRAIGDHLHLEVYQNGKSINPMTVLP